MTDSISMFLAGEIKNVLIPVLRREGELEEIRLRIGKPLLVKRHAGEAFVTKEGILTTNRKEAYMVEERTLKENLQRLCKDSLFAYEDELKQGYISIPGGHRVGLTGQIVQNEDGSVRTMKYINGMNIRISHEIKGVADKMLPFLYENGRVKNTLLISPPGAGKTTMLRDIVRQVSDGNAYGKGICVGVVDERSEIAGCYRGIAQNDVGIRTDVLDACPKVYGMMMLLRSMAPSMIAIDELGGVEDVQALRKASACGAGLLATIHGEDVEDLRKKPYLRELLDMGLFSCYLVLKKFASGPGVKAVYGRNFEICYESSG